MLKTIINKKNHLKNETQHFLNKIINEGKHEIGLINNFEYKIKEIKENIRYDSIKAKDLIQESLSSSQENAQYLFKNIFIESENNWTNKIINKLENIGDIIDLSN